MAHPLMHTHSLDSFALVRYQPNSIILLQTATRKPYQYQKPSTQPSTNASSLSTPLHQNVSHPYLLRPILWRDGMLYAKGCQDLSSLVQARRRDYHIQRFSAEEVANTFQPIFECLAYLHSQGIFYSKITAQHISFFENGDIFLLDWLFNPVGGSTLDAGYSGKSLAPGSAKQNMKELGLLIIETATLIPYEQLYLLSSSELASMLLEYYGAQFTAGVIVLIEGLVEHFGKIVDFMKGNKRSDYGTPLQVKQIIAQGTQIKNLRDKEKQRIAQQKSTKIKLLQSLENEKHKIQTPRKVDQKQLQPSNHPQNTALVDSFQSSPTKKFNITTPNRKIIRLEDSENKKMFNQEVKKRQIEKITKIIQRSNAFVNELMARKNGDKKHVGNVKVNASLYDTQQNSVRKVKDSPKIGSPTKRLRSISKKK